MKRIFVTVIILVPVFTSLAAEAAPSSAEKELVTIMQTILDSIATGDKEPWRRWLADDFVLLDRDGSVKLRSHLVDGTAPLKPGYELKLTMQDIESRDLGDAAVLIYRVVEEMKVFGQPLHVEYRNSHVFEKRDGRWQMLVWQYVELPRDPEPRRGGIRMSDVATDPSPFQKRFEPGHPDADANGYVRYPNVRITDELVDLMDARRVYEANATVFQSAKAMLRRALEI